MEKPTGSLPPGLNGAICDPLPTCQHGGGQEEVAHTAAPAPLRPHIVQAVPVNLQQAQEKPGVPVPSAPPHSHSSYML